MPVPSRTKLFTASYYDCPPYQGEAIQPVSGNKKPFKWLHELSHKDLFAVRTGVLKFRGFVLRQSKIPFTPTVPLTDADFEAKFEQKGVDRESALIWQRSRPIARLT